MVCELLSQPLIAFLGIFHIPLHGLIGKDLRHLGQGVVRLQYGQGLGQELERLITDQLTGIANREMVKSSDEAQ